MESLLTAATALAAAATALAVDRLAERRGLAPPGFGDPLRRGLAAALLALVFWFGVFGPLALVGSGETPDLAEVTTGGLFLMHGLLVLALLAWHALGFGSGAAAGRAGSLPVQLGLTAPRPAEEVLLGLVGGAGALLGVFVLALVVAGLLTALFGEGLLPDRPPPEIVFIAGLPAGTRLALALSAGVVEEAFFRGFLQPRVGIALSSGLFVVAHASYQPAPMLLNLVFVSLLLAALVHWRQNIWPAVVAHALFDAIQLLVVIPVALRLLPPG